MLFPKDDLFHAFCSERAQVSGFEWRAGSSGGVAISCARNVLGTLIFEPPALIRHPDHCKSAHPFVDVSLRRLRDELWPFLTLGPDTT